MSLFNQRKCQVLEYVRENSDTTSSGLAAALDLEIHNARTLLKKYYDQGLLNRRNDADSPAKLYNTTEKGEEREKWMKRRQPDLEDTQSDLESSDHQQNKRRNVSIPARTLASERTAQVQRLRKIAELLENIPDSR